jgi:hypothetical protein
VLDWYAFGPGPNDVLNQIGAATRATYVPNIQGSIVASLDAASGALTKAGFQPFGESQSTAGTFRMPACDEGRAAAGLPQSQGGTVGNAPIGSGAGLAHALSPVRARRPGLDSRGRRKRA